MPLPPLTYGKLECSGDGFTFSSHRRADPSTIALELGNENRPPPAGRIFEKANDDKPSEELVGSASAIIRVTMFEMDYRWNESGSDHGATEWFGSP